MKVWHGLVGLAMLAQVALAGSPPGPKGQAGVSSSPDTAAMEAFGLTDRRVAQPAKEAVRSVIGGGRAADQFFTAKVSLPKIDHAALIAADDANLSSTKRLRVGVSRDVAVDATKGQWHSLAGVGNVWTIAIESQGALGLRIRFGDFHLPEGAYLQVWAPNAPEAINGPFFGEGPLGKGYFWSTIFTGSIVYVEYIAPAGHPGVGAVPFTIDTVSHNYRDYLAEAGAVRGVGSCHNDSSCFSAWAPLRNAVARMSFVDGGQSFVCTGQLLNSLASDLTPYFLTANHCIGIQLDEFPPSDPQDVAETLVATWFYQSNSCDGAVPAIPTLPRSDFADFLARTPLDSDFLDLNLGSDASLLMIRGELPSGVRWSGWTGALPASLAPSTSIHHPAGDFKRISLGTRGPSFGKFWEIDWTDGPTEGGSSGSGIYRNDTQQLYGQLSHGISGCSPPQQELTWDRYGKFSDTLDVFGPFLVEGADDDLEENDTCAGAVDIPSGVYAQRVLKSGDDDWYRISVPSCADLEISASFINAFGDIDLQLFDTCGGVLVAVAQSSTNGETIVIPSGGEPHEYLLRAFLFTNTRNTYDLAVFMPSIAGEPDRVDFQAPSAGLPAPIPDSNIDGLTVALEITEPGTILDLDVQLEISHTWTGDLIVELSKDGTLVTLIDRVGSAFDAFGFADAGFDIVLDDAAVQSIETFNGNGGLVSGTFSPFPGTLSSFAGMDRLGTWTLTVVDPVFQDFGSLISWGLHISTAGESAPQCLRNDSISDFCRILDAPTDLGDFAYFATCFTGPGPAGLNTCCEVFDTDGDDDVDLDDAELFVPELNGP